MATTETRNSQLRMLPSAFSTRASLWLCLLVVLGLTASCRSTNSDGGGDNSNAPATSAANNSSNAGDDMQGGMAAKDPVRPASPPANSGNGSGSGNGAASDLLDSMSGNKAQGEARFYLESGNAKFAEGDFATAEDLYRRALENDPTLGEAKRKLALCGQFLGKRLGELQSIVEQFSDEIQVGSQQRLAEARRLFATGEEISKNPDADERSVNRALRELGRARELLLWFDYGTLETDGLLASTTSLFEETLKRQRQLRRTADDRKKSNALDQQTRLEQESARNRAQRIDKLMGRAANSMKGHEYDTVLQVVEQVLELDPNHRDALRFRKIGVERRNALDYIEFLETNKDRTKETWRSLQRAASPAEAEFVFPERDYWRRADRREQGLASRDLDESFQVLEMKRALATLPANYSFDGEPLTEVVNVIRATSPLNINIDPEVTADELPVTVKLQGVKLQEALNLILENVGLSYTFRDNVLFITEPGKAFGNRFLNVYNVTDLLTKIRDFPGPKIEVQSTDGDDSSSPFSFGDGAEEESGVFEAEGLVDMIKSSTGEDAWDASSSEIESHNGQLLVTATRELHEAVAKVLENLRRDSDLFVIVETRFIDMVDDFLEDIGVDYRNLGQPPGSGFGTDFGQTLNSNRSGGTDLGFASAGNPTNPSLLMGQDLVSGRVQNILDGFVGAAAGSRLTSALRGLTAQVTFLDPYQINAILRATHETRVARLVTAPRITASNGQRVHVSVITQRAYVQDYELVSGGTGLVVQEVADPVIDTFQDGVILDVQPVISADKKYVTIDVRPTLATLVDGIISTIVISLGSIQAAAQQVEIDLPEITLQRAFTSVTVPNGGTVLLGGFRSLNERISESRVPLVGRIWLLKNLFRRRAELREKRSVYILLTAKVVDLRAEEKALFN